MGVKCRFCETRFGGNRYVANRLKGQCGCSGCDGSITGIEKKQMLEHYAEIIAMLKRDQESVRQQIHDYEEKVQWLNDYTPIRE